MLFCIVYVTIVVSAATGEGVDAALSKLGSLLSSRVYEINTAASLPIKKFTDNMSMKVVFVGPEKSGTKTTFINRYVSQSPLRSVPSLQLR